MVDKGEKSPLQKVHPLPWQHYIFSSICVLLLLYLDKSVKPEKKTKSQPMGVSWFLAGVLLKILTFHIHNF